MTYGALIRERRTLLNLKQADLARFLNINKQVISRYENDQADIDCETLNELLKILKIDIKSFIYKDVNAPIKENFNNFNGYLFAKSITYYRRKDYLSLSEVSKITDINRNRLTRIENYESNVDLFTFIKLADFFNVDYEDFFYSKHSNLYFKLDEKDKEIKEVRKGHYFKMCYVICSVILSISIIFEGANSNVRFIDYYDANIETINNNFYKDINNKIENIL